jgi:hypothetical protein
MDYQSVRRQRLWEAMESCRAGSDDLSDPAFADLAARLTEDPELRLQFERLQRADGAIATAFARVPIPAGLADRIGCRLADFAQAPVVESTAAVAANSVNAESVPIAEGPVPAAPNSPVPLTVPAARFSRRGLLIGIASLSAAAALFTAVWIQTHRPRQETRSSVLDEAMEFFNRDDKSQGQLVSQVQPPAEFRMSRDLAWLRDVRWRMVDKFLGGPAVAYDLPSIGGRATLYVVQRNIPGMPAFPPSVPESTGGRSAAAWQVGSILYVLVVEGDAGVYSSYLDHSHGPLT